MDSFDFSYTNTVSTLSVIRNCFSLKMKNQLAYKNTIMCDVEVMLHFLEGRILLFECIKFLTLKAPITTAADDKFCDIFPNFLKNKV